MPHGKIYFWEFERAHERMVVDVLGDIILDRADFVANAAEQGLGVAFVLEWLVATAFAEGRLVRMLEDWCPEEPGFVLYYSGRQRVMPTLRAFIDALRIIDRPSFLFWGVRAPSVCSFSI